MDFTPWLSQDDNIALLADAAGFDITVDETESSVGDFNVDIFASGKSADVIIWVVKHAREEHKAAIEWLNNHIDEKNGFFRCKIKLYKVGTS